MLCKVVRKGGRLVRIRFGAASGVHFTCIMHYLPSITGTDLDKALAPGQDAEIVTLLPLPC